MRRLLSVLNLIAAAPFLIAFALAVAAQLFPDTIMSIPSETNVAIIGGADGPTAIFLATRFDWKPWSLLLFALLLLANGIALWRVSPKAAKVAC